MQTKPLINIEKVQLGIHLRYDKEKKAFLNIKTYAKHSQKKKKKAATVFLVLLALG